ncbi:MAG: metalloprotease TldD [Roseovarius sp.]|nr:metalloprotease TldD [Roseovarius sp.]
MTVNSFQPFETLLDRDVALSRLREATLGGDDGELFLERRRSESLVFDDGTLKAASYNSFEGFGLRAVCGEAAGYAHSSEISESALARAVCTARLAMDGRDAAISDPPRGTSKRLYADSNPIAGRDLSLKIDTLREIDDYLRSADSRVVQVTATIGASLQEIAILRPEGLETSDTRPMTRLNVSVIVEENGIRESGSAGGGGRVMPDGLMERSDWRAKADEALRIALTNLNAEAAPAGVMDVVLGPGWPGILLHEAIGHGLEGDANRKGTSVFSKLMGERIAARGVSVLDDGTIPNRRGSITIDDEGTPSEKNVLIEDGILVDLIQDRQNARLMGVSPTGNGRRESYAHHPMPRMTNTYMLGGDSNPKDILSSLNDGIYAVGFGGGQVDITSGKFVFSCTEAYRVRNGKVGSPVKGATLIGDGATALRKIRAIGNDMALDPGMGNCGKNGQWVPVGVGQPTLMIGGLTVGGSAT